MTAPELAPRSALPGLLTVWIAGAVIAAAIGIFAPLGSRAVWLCIGLGVCLIIAFGVQVFEGRAKGFLFRVSASMLGALLVMGVVSAGFGLAALGSL